MRWNEDGARRRFSTCKWLNDPDCKIKQKQKKGTWI